MLERMVKIQQKERHESFKVEQNILLLFLQLKENV